MGTSAPWGRDGFTPILLGAILTDSNLISQPHVSWHCPDVHSCCLSLFFFYCPTAQYTKSKNSLSHRVMGLFYFPPPTVQTSKIFRKSVFPLLANPGGKAMGVKDLSLFVSQPEGEPCLQTAEGTGNEEGW